MKFQRFPSPGWRGEIRRGGLGEGEELKAVKEFLYRYSTGEPLLREGFTRIPRLYGIFIVFSEIIEKNVQNRRKIFFTNDKI